MNKSIGWLAWPTLAVFIVAWCAFVLSTWAAIHGYITTWVAILINSLAAYLAYSVVHEASHYLLSNKIWLNDLLGHLAMLLLMPTLGFWLYRAVHFCHHQNTNKSLSADPDLWLSRGSLAVKFLKWPSMDGYYFYFYIRRIAFSSIKHSALLLFAVTSSIGVFSLISFYQLWQAFFLYMFLPMRFTHAFLSWTFAYLPHTPHNYSGTNDPYVTTNTPKAYKRWLNMALIGHDYHIVHHLDQSIPFYRYGDAWQSGINR